MIDRKTFNSLIDMLGMTLAYKKAGTTTHVAIPKAGFGRIDTKDTLLVNAYGFTGRVITLKHDALPEAPKKFDEFTIGAERFTADTVSAIYEGGTGLLLGNKIYCKGG
jgi:hypothetical protein